MKLSNIEVYQAYQVIQKIGEIKLPVKSSLSLAKFSIALQPHYQAIEKVRNQLITQFGVKTNNNVTMVGAPQENMDKFVAGFNELMEDDVDVAFDGKIRLPEKVCSTCDKCNHNMDRPLEIEPSLLIPLDKFIEVI